MKHTQGKVEKVHGLGVVRSLNNNVVHKDIAKCAEDLHSPETFANANRITALWNASEGMTNEEAVRYLEHGAEMVDELVWAMDALLEINPKHFTGNKIKNLLALMEGK